MEEGEAMEEEEVREGGGHPRPRATAYSNPLSRCASATCAQGHAGSARRRRCVWGFLARVQVQTRTPHYPSPAEKCGFR